MALVQVLKNNKFSFGLLLLLVVLPFLVSSSLVVLAIKYDEAIRHFSLTAWLLFYFCACFTMAFGLTHTTFIALLSGYFLGLKAIPFVILSYFIASMMGYYLAKKVDQGKFMSSLQGIPGVVGIIDNLKKKEVSVIILARISPALPFAMMNMLLSYLGAEFKRFLWAGFAGMLPRTLLFIWIGTQADNIRTLLQNPSDGELVKISFILLLLVSVFGLFYLIMKAVKNTQRQREK
jgi:uncharacterized membrane protein YdjX (TVP38/TMEM64 family)